MDDALDLALEFKAEEMIMKLTYRIGAPAYDKFHFYLA